LKEQEIQTKNQLFYIEYTCIYIEKIAGGPWEGKRVHLKKRFLAGINICPEGHGS